VAFSASSIVDKITGALGNRSDWESRLKEAAYKSPKGTRIKFKYEEVSMEVTLRHSLFEFNGVNNGYIQQNGYGSRRYPMLCIFTGITCDLEAAAFVVALLEPGYGTLEHPLYGSIPSVTPFGDITRRDDLVNNANQTILEVTFWTSTGAEYPSNTGSPKNEIESALGGFDVVAAQSFANKTQLSKVAQALSAMATVRKFLREASQELGKISDSVSTVNRQFRDLQSTINFGLDVLIGQPLLLAQQISNLVKAPGKALTGIQQRLEGYEAFAARVFGSSSGNPALTLISGVALPVRTTKIANDFHISDLFAMSAVAGSIVSVLNHQFTTKPEALAAAETILDQLNTAIEWREAGFAALGDVEAIGAYQVDTGETQQALEHAAALTAGFLIQISFSLIPERRVVLDRSRTIIDLCAELYGSVDDRLDFLITSNNLSGSEILELPKGKRIVYYT
jgi:hypothetical protein